MKLYANESDVLRIGGLQFENRLDRITVSGDIDLTKDAAGLADARALQALLAQIVAELEASADLPERIPAPQVKKTGNPFE
jgi:hypothetical protein